MTIDKLITTWILLLFAGGGVFALSAMPSIPLASMPVAAPPKEMSVLDIKRQARLISYTDLARYPDYYRGTLLQYEGKVMQVMEDGLDLVMRIDVAAQRANTFDHDIVMVWYRTKPGAPRILENDRVTFWGKSAGIQSYKAVLGHTIQIPGVLAQVLEQGY